MEDKLNKKLSGRNIGIVLSGVIIQVVYLLITDRYLQFKNGRIDFSIGLWIGVAAALVLSSHMYHAISRALDMEPEEADRYMKQVYLVRALLIVVVAGIVYFSGIGYVMATFLGMLCLEFGAFLYALAHKLL